MELTSSNSRSRFRFRDHNNDDDDDDYNSRHSHTTADSDEDSDSELQSMTAKGVQHLCSELLELKQESDEDFQRDICSNYAAFISILKEIEGLQSDLSQLKSHALSQKCLVENVSNIISLDVLSEEIKESTLGESYHIQPSSPSILENHTKNVSEMLDTLLSEHKLDDALSLLDMEADFFQKMQSDQKHSPDQLLSYNSTISEKRAMLSDQFILAAKHPRVSAPDLQKALLGLHRLGDSHPANQLLFQYYRSRISSGIHDLQSSKQFKDVLYIQQLAKYICSMISQAVKSYFVLNEETYPSSELLQWTCEEVEVLAACLVKYVESISERNGRLSTTVDALQIAMAYCSLLDTQKIFLQSCLIENIRPCIEEVLQSHIGDLSQVIRIVTSNDTWVLERYSVSGILLGRNYEIIDQQPEYYLLTNSGRKFVILFQSVAEEVSRLLDMQMEGSIWKGLTDLFTAYFVIPDSVVSGDTDVIVKGIPRSKLTDPVTLKVFILINLSTLIQFCSSIIRHNLRDIHGLEFEIDNYLLSIQDMYSRVNSSFLEQFISNIFSPHDGHEFVPQSSLGLVVVGDSRIYDLIPSVPYLELYLELSKLQKLADDDCIDVNWLVSFFNDVIDATLEWISNKSEIWMTDIESLADHRTEFLQFALDTQFLVEIARSRGYLTEGMITLSSNIISRLEESFNSAGLHPLRDLNDEDWLSDAAVRALQKLQELHAKESVEEENLISTKAAEESNQEKNPSLGNNVGSTLGQMLEQSVFDPVVIADSAIDARTETLRTEEDTQ